MTLLQYYDVCWYFRIKLNIKKMKNFSFYFFGVYSKWSECKWKFKQNIYVEVLCWTRSSLNLSLIGKICQNNYVMTNLGFTSVTALHQKILKVWVWVEKKVVEHRESRKTKFFTVDNMLNRMQCDFVHWFWYNRNIISRQLKLIVN